MAVAGCSSPVARRAVDDAAPTSIAPPATGTVGPVGAPPVVPSGFEAVTLRVTAPTAPCTSRACWSPITDAERARGLMDVDSLGGYDGMIFRFGTPTTAQFYMFHTRLPLIDRLLRLVTARYVSATDMPPCTAAKRE